MKRYITAAPIMVYDDEVVVEAGLFLGTGRFKPWPAGVTFVVLSSREHVQYVISGTAVGYTPLSLDYLEAWAVKDTTP